MIGKRKGEKQEGEERGKGEDRGGLGKRRR